MPDVLSYGGGRGRGGARQRSSTFQVVPLITCLFHAHLFTTIILDTDSPLSMDGITPYSLRIGTSWERVQIIGANMYHPYVGHSSSDSELDTPCPKAHPLPPSAFLDTTSCTTNASPDPTPVGAPSPPPVRYQPQDAPDAPESQPDHRYGGFGFVDHVDLDSLGSENEQASVIHKQAMDALPVDKKDRISVPKMQSLSPLHRQRSSTSARLKQTTNKPHLVTATPERRDRFLANDSDNNAPSSPDIMESSCVVFLLVSYVFHELTDLLHQSAL
ncbi:hypothetical protein OF83DRAFT_1088740 [Amylostereum chailletii]|nr:hypothetical protein OF83DRAFT_1088740 [Amylostereum chailletii]